MLVWGNGLFCRSWTPGPRQGKTRQPKSFRKPREFGLHVNHQPCGRSLVVFVVVAVVARTTRRRHTGCNLNWGDGENPPASCPAQPGRGEHHYYYYLLRTVCVSMIPAIALNTHQRELLLPLLLVRCGSLSLMHPVR